MRGWGVALVMGVSSSCAGAKIDEGPLSAGLVSGAATTATDSSTSGDTDATGNGSAENGSAAEEVTGNDGATETTAPADASGEDSGTSVGGTDETTGAESESGDRPPVCGDGQTDVGEECDDANQVDTDACLTNCTAASCGDNLVHAGVEACDDGVNDGGYGGCSPGCATLGPHCGDGAVQASNEHCDGASGWVNVGCTACLYDFSTIPQLYCNGTCTWAGGSDCDQADADIYCKLVTGDSNSTAQSFNIVTALDAPGFSCPNYGTNLGALPAFGVAVNVWYQDTSILANHGSGFVVSAATCS